MENADKLRRKWQEEQLPIGCGISFSDPAIAEAMSNVLDFLFIDMEHNALSLETVQAHIMATRGSDAAALVRVPWNDPVLIKPVLDIGADGICVPLIRTADDARLSVQSCLYPPDGIRGFGPRRPLKYGLVKDRDYCQVANKKIIVIVQIEHIDAVNNLDEILAVPGVTAVLVGPNDLSGSMGLMGQTNHPDVVSAIETTVAKCRKAGVFVSIGLADNPDLLIDWVDKGMQWILAGVDWAVLMGGILSVSTRLREHFQKMDTTS